MPKGGCMNFWSKLFPIHTRAMFAAAAGALFLAMFSGLINSNTQGALPELSAEVPQQFQVGNLGQRLAELNSAVNQSLAWEGAGFKTSTIAALDQRIAKDLAHYASDLQAQQTSQLTPAQRELLQQIQQDFAKYRQTALDALDIKTGMLGNAAFFMTVIDNHYVLLSEHLSQWRALESALSVAAVERGSMLAQRNQQWFFAGALIAAGLLVLWLNKGGGALLLLQKVGGVRAQTSSQGLVGRVPTTMHEEMSERLSHIIRVIRRTEQAAEGFSTSPARVPHSADHAGSLQKTTTPKVEVAKSATQVSALLSQASEFSHQGEPSIQAVAQAMQCIDDQTRKISQTIGVFDFIAFRTNVLALTAAQAPVRPDKPHQDAAAAAQEWLSLAQTGRDAAKEMRGLFNGLLAQVRTGNVRVQAAGDSMARIASNIRQVSAALQQLPQVACGKHGAWGRASRRSQRCSKATHPSAPWWNTQHPWLRQGKNKTSN
jgi:methyl-accepting chemotaxis protein